jgi:hypothetical protein
MVDRHWVTGDTSVPLSVLACPSLEWHRAQLPDPENRVELPVGSSAALVAVAATRTRKANGKRCFMVVTRLMQLRH